MNDGSVDPWGAALGARHSRWRFGRLAASALVALGLSAETRAAKRRAEADGRKLLVRPSCRFVSQ